MLKMEVLNIKEEPLENEPELRSEKLVVKHLDHGLTEIKEEIDIDENISYFSILEVHNSELGEQSGQDYQKRCSENIKPRKMKCETCGKLYVRFRNFVVHQKKHKKMKHKHLCTVCQKGFPSKVQITKHMKCHTEEFQCHICSKRFSYKHALVCHLKIHTKNHVCQLCDMNFHTKHQLHIHLDSHSKIKPYKCHICENSFEFSSSLIWHLKLHTYANSFYCSECGETLANFYIFRDHLERHLKDRGIKWCNVCGEHFNCREKLSQHKMLHAPIKKRQHSCTKCDRKFVLQSSLALHISRHLEDRGISCEECGLHFITSKELRRHRQTHPRKIKCRECLLFVKTTDFTAHLRTHSGPKLFQCKECDESFKFSTDLVIHFQQHLQQS